MKPCWPVASAVVTVTHKHLEIDVASHMGPTDAGTAIESVLLVAVQVQVAGIPPGYFALAISGKLSSGRSPALIRQTGIRPLQC